MIGSCVGGVGCDSVVGCIGSIGSVSWVVLDGLGAGVGDGVVGCSGVFVGVELTGAVGDAVGFDGSVVCVGGVTGCGDGVGVAEQPEILATDCQ